MKQYSANIFFLNFVRRIAEDVLDPSVRLVPDPPVDVLPRLGGILEVHAPDGRLVVSLHVLVVVEDHAESDVPEEGVGIAEGDSSVGTEQSG